MRTSVLATLVTTITLLFGGISPNVAQAAEAPGSPVATPGILATSVTAFNGDNVALNNCSYQNEPLSFQYFHAGYRASSYPTANVNTTIGVASDVVSCSNNQALNAQDGTFYATRIIQNNSGVDALTFVAMKNGRMLWSSDLGNQNDPVCGSMTGWGSEAHDEQMTNASIGSDGNIYGLVQQSNPGCATYLAAISSVDGHVIFKQLLTNYGSFKGGRVWTYSDKILTIDNVGVVRQFGYDGTENTSAAYEFPTSTIGTITNSYANADGRVFVTGTGTGSDTVIGYLDLNGQTGTISSGLGSNPGSRFTPGAGGTFVAVNNLSGAVTTYHISSTGITTTSASGLSYSTDHAAVTNYWQDTNGNAVMIRQLLDSNWASVGVTVDEIDGTSGAVTNLLLVSMDSTHPSPALKAADISPDGTTLFAAICHDTSNCPNSNTTIDAWLHKVPLTGFGSVIKDANSFTTYTPATPKVNYVALGDSYSSGEGDMSYLTGTDQNGDFCHRSSLAYPELLEQNTSLNLNMTAFVACSGATEDKILGNNVPNGELPQALAITGDTNLITMSIGGNDANFAGTLSTCTLKQTETDAQKAASMSQSQADAADCAQALSAVGTTLSAQSFTDNLTTLYNQVQSAVPAAKLVIVGYPALFTSSSTLSSSCEWGTPATDAPGLTSGRPVSSSEVASIEGLTDQIDGDIITAIANTNNSKISFVDPRPLFAANALCTANPWLNGPLFNVNLDYVSGSYHPNPTGQQGSSNLAVMPDWLTL